MRRVGLALFLLALFAGSLIDREAAAQRATWSEWATATTYHTTNFRVLYQSGSTRAEYAKAVGDYTQQARDALFGRLGYKEPSWLEDTKLDIYIRPLEDNVLGIAPYNLTRGVRVFNPWIEINMESVIWGNGSDAGYKEHRLKSLVAHEFFHIVQFGYDVHERLWLMESTATWIEDKVFPTPKKYWHLTGYKDRFGEWTANRDEMSTLSSKDTNEYAASAFFQFLSERRPGGNQVIRKIWEEAAKTSGPNVYGAIGKAIGDSYSWGDNFKARIGDFAATTLIKMPSLHGTYSLRKLEEDEDDAKYGPYLSDDEERKMTGIALKSLNGNNITPDRLELKPFQPGHYQIEPPRRVPSYQSAIKKNPDGLAGKLVVLVRGLTHRDWDFRLIEAPVHVHDSKEPRGRFTVRKFPRIDLKGQWVRLEVERFPEKEVYLSVANLKEVERDVDIGPGKPITELSKDAFEIAAVLLTPPIVSSMEVAVEEYNGSYRPVWKVEREKTSRPGRFRTRTALDEGVYYDKDDPVTLRLTVETSRPVKESPALYIGNKRISLSTDFGGLDKTYFTSDGSYAQKFTGTIAVTEFTEAIRRLDGGETSVLLDVRVRGHDAWDAWFDENLYTVPRVSTSIDKAEITIEDWEGDRSTGPGGSDKLSGKQLPIHKVEPASYLARIEAEQGGKVIYEAQWRANNARAGDRQLDIKTAEPYDPEKELEVSLEFSEPVVDVKVTLGSATNETFPGGVTEEILPHTEWGQTEYFTSFAPSDVVKRILKDEKLVGLHVEAAVKDGEKIDADPRTPARYDFEDKRWYSLEESARLSLRNSNGGTDRWHKLNASGRSFVMLLDASGSMSGGRMSEAKSGIAQAVRSLQPTDEAALIVFFTCGDIRITVPFTQDVEDILKALPGIRASGNTPLGDAIRFANKYMTDNARFQKRKLLTFSDGQTTCGASAATAVSEIEPEPEKKEEPKEEDKPREVRWTAHKADTDNSSFVANYWVDVVEYQESDYDDNAKDRASLTIRRHPVSYISSRGRTVWSINWSSKRIVKQKQANGAGVEALRQEAEAERRGSIPRDQVEPTVQRMIGPGAEPLRRS